LVAAFAGKIWRVDLITGLRTAIPFQVHVARSLGPLVKFAYSLRGQPLISHAIRNPQISPDGTKLTFVALDRVWIMALPDGTPKRLTIADDVESYPVWSPDGQYVSYATCSDSRGGSISRTSIAGSERTAKLTPVGDFFEKLAYSPDGGFIFAIHSSRADLSEIRGACSHYSPVDVAVGLDIIRV